MNNKKTYGKGNSYQRRYTKSFDHINSNGYSPSSQISKSLMTLQNLRENPQIIKPIKISYSRREVKKAQKLFIIVVFFMLCWIPLYTYNTVQAFCLKCRPPFEILVDSLIILSHINSVGSPFLYAFHMKDFREALRRLLCHCILQPRRFRDVRRQELLNMHHRRIVNINDFLATSTNNTPEISPNLSLDRIGNRLGFVH